jgi:hypothetical protein
MDLPRELDAVIARAMAKDPRRRFQTGAEFAAAVAELHAALVPAGTHTGTRTGSLMSAGALNNPSDRMANAARIIHSAVMKAPIKDLVLGAATIALLTIVGVQAKLLVFTREEGAATSAVASAQADPSMSGTTSPPMAAAAAPAAKDSTLLASSKAAAKNPKSLKPASHAGQEVVVPLSTVELTVHHQFKDATISVWVDGKLALMRQLHGGTQKHLVLFNGVRGSESETFQVPAGKHVLKLRTQTADQTIDLSKTVSADLIGGGDKTLAVTFDKHNAAMLVEWQ